MRIIARASGTRPAPTRGCEQYIIRSTSIEFGGDLKALIVATLVTLATMVVGCSKPAESIRGQLQEVRLSDGTQCVAIVHNNVVQTLTCNWKPAI